MVTGASTADLAIVLVDAREGLLTQSRRHAAIAGAARDPADRARRQQDGPRRLRRGRLPAHLRRVPRAGRRAWTSRSSPASRSPRCKGDNVVERSENLAWFGGPTLLQYLEEAPVAAGLADGPLRLPVQWVVRDQETEHRGYAGQLAGGTVRVGDEVVVLPAGTTHAGGAIDAPSGAGRGRGRAAVDRRAARGPARRRARRDDLPRRRGAALGPRDRRDGLLARRGAQRAARALPAQAHDATVRAVLDTIHHTLEVEQLTERPDADCLSRNEIGRVTLRTSARAVLRPLRRQPHDGLVHPHRRGDQRDRRRGDDR